MPRHLVRAILVSVSVSMALAVTPANAFGVSPCQINDPSAGGPGAPPAFVVLPDGSETDVLAVDGLVRCTLARADGSTFAQAIVDNLGHILGVAFYRLDGTPLVRIDASLPADATDAHRGALVQCDIDAENPVDHAFFHFTIEWWVTSTAPGLDPGAVVSAIRAAHTEWTNNENYCGYADNSSFSTAYQGNIGKSYGKNGYSTFGWGDLSAIGCSGALACTDTWYDLYGNPVETDTRMSNAVNWTLNPTATRCNGTSYDVQELSAHEVGHSAQFDHVTNGAEGDWTNLMWPYFCTADTSGRMLGRGDSLEDNTYY